ncbi:rod-binding protein [Azospirillum sp. SYSU D00513]|uniref:rod-binding protein n=1 Tax=Azospirillum sp. SYSU D00513 TaxID=2812561 RepID=UPI001A97999E|nr:rod-binding protein [Azospirillum sp. SYSU D00513]
MSTFPASGPLGVTSLRSAAGAGETRPGERPVAPVIKARAEEFEGVVLGLFVKSMFAGVRGGSMGGGNAEAQWRDLLCDEYGKALATDGGLGIATLVATQMQDLQDQADARTAATVVTNSTPYGKDHDDFHG